MFLLLSTLTKVSFEGRLLKLTEKFLEYTVTNVFRSCVTTQQICLIVSYFAKLIECFLFPFIKKVFMSNMLDKI